MLFASEIWTFTHVIPLINHSALLLNHYGCSLLMFVYIQFMFSPWQPHYKWTSDYLYTKLLPSHRVGKWLLSHQWWCPMRIFPPWVLCSGGSWPRMRWSTPWNTPFSHDGFKHKSLKWSAGNPRWVVPLHHSLIQLSAPVLCTALPCLSEHMNTLFYNSRVYSSHLQGIFNTWWCFLSFSYNRILSLLLYHHSMTFPCIFQSLS